MKKSLVLLTILTLLTLTSYSQCQVSKVYINAVLSDPNSVTNNFDTDGDGTASTNDDEFVQICNDSTGDVAITGWTISDNVGVRYTFGTDTIRAGECLTIITDYSGSSPMPSYFRDVNNGTAIWNNGGDDVILSDGTNSCTETYGAQTAGCVTLLAGTNSDDCSLTPANLGTGPIPVELVYFKAEANNDNVLLSWATASELNNDYFEIQKSLDGRDFLPLQIVNGQGTTTQLTEYRAQDRPSKSAKSIFYRLKQVDYDGKVEFYNVVKLERAITDFVVSRNDQNIEVTFSDETLKDYTLTDITGKLLQTGSIHERLVISEQDSPKGFVILTTSNGSSVSQIKLFIH